MTEKEWFDLLVLHANAYYDGHFTINKFTSNYRVCFGTFDHRDTRKQIQKMAEGKTLSEAIKKAIEENNCAYDY